ncbi:hypothetical protein HUU59_10920 [bacterium]|nr:hypothetical protein [bacterium]
MTRDYQEIAEAIARRMRGVAEIGNVHIGRKLTQSSDEFRAIHFYEPQSRIHSWSIAREGFSDEQVATGHLHDVTHRFRIRGYLSLLNEVNSDLQFQRLVSGVANALDDDSDLDQACELAFPVQAETITEREFYETVCHYCELTLQVREHHQSA